MVGRRRFLRAALPGVVGGTHLLSGCADPDQMLLDQPNSTGEGGGLGQGNGSERLAISPRTPGTERDYRDPDYGTWFDDVSNFEGTVVFDRDTEMVDVSVGAEGNGGNRAFEPAAIAIPTGTIVRWRWTGEGGAHNIVAVDGSFASGDPVSREGHTYGLRFPVSNVHLYYSEPSRDSGMKGAVSVYEEIEE